ncbi:WSC domain-containing protein-like protein 5 [Colletotrichum chlorophyti]|uniref:WSC domain-containing protein-like protein 5 n=1 Tax=Colletotrichum chlorophyti TaxID=708187 RepID=A0A1Q8RWV1_9PEZI|nr:WSC domain-containing protein-like protein 5 [Colletotrichum chlorophyti]
MHVSSYLSIAGLALAAITSAQDKIPNGAVLGAENPIDVDSGTPAEKRSTELYSRGTSVQRHVLKRAVNGICDALPSKWEYKGCFVDTPSNRVLPGASYSEDGTGSEGLTQEKCIAFCDQRGYSVAGVEWGKECYCGYAVPPTTGKAAETDCGKPCTGNGEEVCGNGGRINVFTNGDAAPSELQASGDFKSIGCYSDSPSARTLTTRMSLSGNVRVSDCTTACASKGFPYAGLEFGQECFCGGSIQNGGHSISGSLCNLPCTADHSQLCGGRDAINIYQTTVPQQGPSTINDGWKSKSCYTDSPSGRTLSFKVPDFSSFSAAQCVSKCFGSGYRYAGLEFGCECFCGNTLDNNNSPASSGCDMACAGNRADTCGGSGRINIYEAPCGGTKGCHYNFGLYQTNLVSNVQQCSNLCQLDRANCKAYQYGRDIDDNGELVTFCNLFSKSIAEIKGSSTTARCLSFNFYPSVCAL